MLVGKRRVVALGERPHYPDAALRQLVDLLFYLVQRSHIRSNVKEPIPIPGLRLPVAELVNPVLVDAEVVRQLVQDGDPDLLLEPLRIPKLTDERTPEDGDLVRQV